MDTVRRRTIYNSTDNNNWEPIRLQGYVLDGLVFHLDGIETGSEAEDTWIDLIGGVKFTLQGDCEKINESGELHNGYVLFPHTGMSYAKADKACLNDIDPANCTIEALYSIDGLYDPHKHAPVFFSGSTTDNNLLHIGLMGQHYTANQFNFIPSSVNGKRWYLAPNTIDRSFIDASFSSTIGLVNGTNATPTGNVMTRSHNVNYAVVGAMLNYDYINGEWSDLDFLHGKIYSIRVYNRCLTQEEIKLNSNFDLSRFTYSNTGDPAIEK